MAEVILAEQSFDFVLHSGWNVYMATNVTSLLFELTEDETYTIVWDGITYQCTAAAMSLGELSGLGIGNKAIMGIGDDTGEPFVIAYIPEYNQNSFVSNDTTETTHMISIYKGTFEEETPSVSIVLYDRTGAAVTYEGIETITTDTPVDGERATFTHGVLMDGAEVELDMTDGDQVVSVPDGYLIKKATLKKPENLLPEYIKKGINVAGVVGEFAGDEAEKTVDLDMADGNQVIEADADTVMTKVTVTKPGTMLPENIKKGVEIGGVTGTFIGDGQEKTVELDMLAGDQVIEADADTVLSKVIITKPDALVPENIKKDVEIGGVVGIFILPQLYAPTLSKNGDFVTVYKTSSNGDFTITEYKLYVDGVLFATQDTNVFDISTLDFSTHEIQATITGENFLESPKSDSISVTKLTVTMTLTNLTSDASDHAWLGESLTITLVPDEGYSIPTIDTVSLSQGNYDNGVITTGKLVSNFICITSGYPIIQYFTLVQGQISIYVSNGYLQSTKTNRVSHVATDVLLKPGTDYRLVGVSGVRYGVQQLLAYNVSMIEQGLNINNTYKLDSGWQETGYEFTSDAGAVIAWLTASFSSGDITPDQAMPVYLEELV
ncbi:MAG: hypothetical protein J6C37_10715 [Roseburia sp.]|nr:hypothetical protein [Roseburia sp.]